MAPNPRSRSPASARAGARTAAETATTGTAGNGAPESRTWAPTDRVTQSAVNTTARVTRIQKAVMSIGKECATVSCTGAIRGSR